MQNQRTGSQVRFDSWHQLSIMLSLPQPVRKWSVWFCSICVTALALRDRSSDAETHDVIAVVGRIAFPGGRSQQPRRKHPRAAAIHSEAIALAVVRLRVARRGLVRAAVGRNAGVAVVVTVFGPLPNVPCHVVKAECVRRLGADRMRSAMIAI